MNFFNFLYTFIFANPNNLPVWLTLTFVVVAVVLSIAAIVGMVWGFTAKPVPLAAAE